MDGSETSIIISPSSDVFVTNCTTIHILDDNFAEATESLTIELIPMNLELYVVSEVSRRTVINIIDDEGKEIYYEIL